MRGNSLNRVADKSMMLSADGPRDEWVDQPGDIFVLGFYFVSVRAQQQGTVWEIIQASQAPVADVSSQLR